VVSDALLVRATDRILLFSITDITELIWTTHTLPAVARPARAAPPKRVEPLHIGTHPRRADRNPLCHNMLQAFPH
jgi:hypothetical protein